MRDLLGTQPLELGDLLIVGAASILGYAAIRLDRIIHPATSPPTNPGDARPDVDHGRGHRV
jgi:Ca2+-transporting ATPase